MLERDKANFEFMETFKKKSILITLQSTWKNKGLAATVSRVSD